MNHSRLFCGLLAALVITLAGCASEPASFTDRKLLADDATLAMRQMKATDPTLAVFLDSAYGYAVFPNVGSGGLIAGGAHGYGVVYEGNNLIGYSELTQASIGGQIGGKAYEELLVFEDRDAMLRFNSGKVTFGAEVSAVALDAGAAKSTRYLNGVAVFRHSTGGLMAAAVVSGQQFTFLPK